MDWGKQAFLFSNPTPPNPLVGAHLEGTLERAFSVAASPLPPSYGVPFQKSAHGAIFADY